MQESLMMLTCGLLALAPKLEGSSNAVSQRASAVLR